MRYPIALVAISSIATITLLSGLSTYAFFTASISNGPNDFSSFAAESVNIGTTPNEGNSSPLQMRALFATNNSQTITFPMFYDHSTFPTGPNPYDFKTSSSLSGEIPGGWAPGDQVSRYWTIQNKGSSAKVTEIEATLTSLKDKSGANIPSTLQAYQDFLNHMRVNVYSPEDNYHSPVFTGTFADLVSNAQPLNTIMYLANGCSGYQVKFTTSMDLNADNDLQGVKGVLDFSLGAEQCQNNCFDPPFSNRNYSMKLGSTTPIKFECYDSDGNFINASDNKVSLVISGPRVGGGMLDLTYTLNNGLSANGGHYQAQVYGDPALFVDGGTYTATVYYGNKIYCQKSFSTEPGNRSNAP